MKEIIQDIQEYEFTSFGTKDLNGEVHEYSFESLEGKTIQQIEETQKIIKIERTHSEANSFDISPIVEKHRGLKKQEMQEREERILDEVSKRVAKIEEEAYKKGHDEGINQGRQDIYDETRAQTEEKMIALSEMISETLSSQELILKSQKTEIYNLIRNITKWIILRELKDDGSYLERLLEKLIIETQQKSNLLIQVDQKYFEQMPEVLETVQKKLGEFVNVRLESDFDIQGTGIVIESENGIINASLKEQFNSLDKLFETIGITNVEGNEDIGNDTE